MRYDVVVAGAGPVGSAVSREVAKAGLKVLLLEDHREIGRPLQCSGFVTPRTLDEVGDGAEALVLSRVKGAIVHGPAGGKVALGGERVRALALNRVELDRLMAEGAESAGAKLQLATRLVGIERVNGHLELTISQGPGARRSTLESSLLVGADGWNSTVARWMGLPRCPLIPAVSIDAELAGHPPDMAQVFVGNRVAPGWFAWTIPLGDGMVRIGIGCDPAHTALKPRQLLDDLLARFPEEFQGLRPLSFAGGFIPLYQRGEPPTPTSTDHAMVVGDAAGQVKPTSGGGIYTGLLGARHAAGAAIAALERGDLSAAALAPYEAGWRGELQEEFERAADVRELFLRLTDQQLERFISLLRLPGMQRIIRKYGDIDFQSPLYGRLLRAAPILRRVFSLPALLPLRWSKLLGKGGSKRARPSNEMSG